MRIFSRNSNNAQSKKLSAIKISSAILLYLCVILIIGFAGCSQKSDDTKTATQITTELQIDEETYTFSEGIMIGSLSAGGKTYREIHTAAKKEVESLVKDFKVLITAGEESHEFKRDDPIL